jgi:hypothetical protein
LPERKGREEFVILEEPIVAGIEHARLERLRQIILIEIRPVVNGLSRLERAAEPAQEPRLAGAGRALQDEDRFVAVEEALDERLHPFCQIRVRFIEQRLVDQFLYDVGAEAAILGVEGHMEVDDAAMYAMWLDQIPQIPQEFLEHLLGGAPRRYVAGRRHAPGRNLHHGHDRIESQHDGARIQW